MISTINRLADDFDTLSLLLPSSRGLASLVSHTTEPDGGITPAMLHSSTPWSTCKDQAQRMQHVAHLQPDEPLRMQMLGTVVHSLLEGSIKPEYSTLLNCTMVSASAKAKTAAQRLLSIHSKWMGAACSFITTAVEQLRLLVARETASAATSQGPVNLWWLVILHCQVLELRLLDWPMEHMQASAPLFAALSSLTDLLLDCGQSDRGGAMQAKLVGTCDQWEAQVLIVLRAPQGFLGLFRGSSLPQDVASAQLRLPRSLVNKVCLLAAHHLRLELATPHLASRIPLLEESVIGVTCMLVSTLARCVHELGPRNRPALCKAVLGDAALELCKLALLTCIRYPP